MKKYIQELRELYEGVQNRLTDREMIIFDTMRYVSNSQCSVDREQTIFYLKQGRGAHYPTSTYVTNQGSNLELPDLEIREITNLIAKLESWGLLYIPNFGVPIWSMNIFGGPKTNDYQFFGFTIELDPRNVKKVRLSHLREIIKGQEVIISRA
ncbi:hypothetical protein [Rossellomorea yichunensis]|uniref:hypothetical protein n=1 Tax=Rossellomorea yichunensis TaxID=3077331 RepID=UPI0028DDB442|nr:hypothetical protein [Rossellomorea sp. YC4-1]MDT9027878.1 hypothetical protein [Rossellomorea sp. YC4-1]